MWSKLKRRLARNEKIRATEKVVCKNCETEFVGHFCPHCGQAVSDFDRPFSFIFYNFLGDFFAFDERFFRTTIDLIIKPGFLTKEYFEGRRIRYAPPFRIFIFTSFLMFLLLQVYTNRGLNAILDTQLKDKNPAVDSTALASLDSIILKRAESIEYADSLDKMNVAFNFENLRNGNLRHNMEVLAIALEEKQETETDPKKRRQNRELIHILRTPEQVTAKVLKYMSYSFFLLLPIFALILKLFYIRRRQNYIRHLIFSLHCHSYTFFIILIITSLYLIVPFDLGLISFLLLLTLPVYFVTAMYKFYGQKLGKTIFKFLGISFIYSVVFWTALIVVLYNALNLSDLF